MTTRVTVENGPDSNPAQELVVVCHNACSGDQRHKVLKPGERAEWWIASHSNITLVERQA